jgi:hypothetical protein
MQLGFEIDSIRVGPMRSNSVRSAAAIDPEIATTQAAGFENEPTRGVAGGVISQMVSRSLSVKRRGAIGHDGMVVRNLSARLRVQLLARRNHPWDRDRPANERTELFVQQCLEDVSTAIPNLFRSMPEIDEMEILVLDPRGKTVIISGIVKRSDALTPNFLSPGMKLRAMGLIYGRSNSGFEHMDDNPVVILNASDRPSNRSNSRK